MQSVVLAFSCGTLQYISKIWKNCISESNCCTINNHKLNNERRPLYRSITFCWDIQHTNSIFYFTDETHLYNYHYALFNTHVQPLLEFQEVYIFNYYTQQRNKTQKSQLLKEVSVTNFHMLSFCGMTVAQPIPDFSLNTFKRLQSCCSTAVVILFVFN
jgi:hypothetical protein